ncbi:hypothetical protein PISL3812_05450 [Talaromyces islandicus]|uniref:Enoyl reductase (ER) domain-containing protein n=1 Tax=Talaromyces islandicus TaxID=28573 RepID=A0A0U1M0C1_TALIS|nr:hypothetical protein PISL3812_05450 [Talaromyces islandicus]
MNPKTTVKAWTYTAPGYPDTIKLTDYDIPSTPAPGHLLIKIHAVALNSVDITLMNLPFWHIPWLQYPKVLCEDYSGTVIAAGENTSFKKGDTVFGFSKIPGRGGLAEVVHIREKGWFNATVKKPDSLTHQQAASLPLVWFTAKACMDSVIPYVTQENQKVAILGGSTGVGIYLIHLAKQQGWEVLATCSAGNEELVKGLGADSTADYTSQNVREETTKFQPDAIIDCVGGTECIGVARKRYVTIIGDKTDRNVMGGPSSYFHGPWQALRWVKGFLGLGERYDVVELGISTEHLLEASKLEAEKIIIDSVFPFSEVKSAFERLETGRARGKIIIEI